MAYKFVDQPKALLEEEYEILLPTEDEMLRFPNQKLQIVASQLKNSILASMNVDSARHQMHLADDDYALIIRSDEASQAFLDTYIGTGMKRADGGFDTGIKIPALMELGQVEPDVDQDRASLKEPGPDGHDLNISTNQPAE